MLVKYLTNNSFLVSLCCSSLLYSVMYVSHSLLCVSARSTASNHSNASSKPAVDPRHTKFLEGEFVIVLLLLLQRNAVAAAKDFLLH